MPIKPRLTCAARNPCPHGAVAVSLARPSWRCGPGVPQEPTLKPGPSLRHRSFRSICCCAAHNAGPAAVTPACVTTACTKPFRASHGMTLKQRPPKLNGIDVLSRRVICGNYFRCGLTADRIRGVFNDYLGGPFCSPGWQGRNILRTLCTRAEVRLERLNALTALVNLIWRRLAYMKLAGMRPKLVSNDEKAGVTGGSFFHFHNIKTRRPYDGRRAD